MDDEQVLVAADDLPFTDPPDADADDAALAAELGIAGEGEE